MGASTNATTNYPANILGGLWTDINQTFAGTPYGNTQGAQQGAYGGASNLGAANMAANNSQFGYNPYQTQGAANNLTSLAGSGSLGALGLGGYNQLTGAGNTANQQLGNISQGAIGAGNNIYGALSGLGNSIYGTLGGAGGNLLNSYQGGIGGLTGSYLPGAEQSIGTNNQYAGQALTNAFDPQKALHDKLFGEQQQQNLASQAASGTSTTPYGAGLTQQGNQNFDIAWQQAQLANQAQGANTAATLQGANANTAGAGSSMLGQLLSGAQGLYGTGASALQGLYGTGASALQGLYGTGASALGEGASAMQGLYGTGASNYSNLLGAGTNALTAGANVGQQQQGFDANLQQQSVTDFLNYLSGSQGQDSALFQALTGAYNASTGQYSAANTAMGNQAQINQQGLEGLGKGLGSLLGLGLGFL